MNDELGPGFERALRHGVHVPDDQVGPVSLFEQRVGAAVDPHEQRPHLADVGLERGQVLLVLVATHDDQHVTAGHDVLELGEPRPAEQQVAFSRKELHSVGGEALEPVGEPELRRLHRSAN